MPSKSIAQERFMRAVAHSAKFAKEVGVPQDVGKEFEKADKMKKRTSSKNMSKKMYSLAK